MSSSYSYAAKMATDMGIPIVHNPDGISGGKAFNPGEKAQKNNQPRKRSNSTKNFNDDDDENSELSSSKLDSDSDDSGGNLSSNTEENDDEGEEEESDGYMDECFICEDGGGEFICCVYNIYVYCITYIIISFFQLSQHLIIPVSF